LLKKVKEKKLLLKKVKEKKLLLKKVKEKYFLLKKVKEKYFLLKKVKEKFFLLKKVKEKKFIWLFSVKKSVEKVLKKMSLLKKFYWTFNNFLQNLEKRTAAKKDLLVPTTS